MAGKLQDKLVQLEYQYSGKKLSDSAYKNSKWATIREAQSSQELLSPVIKTKFPKVVEDSVGQTFQYIPATPFILGADDEYGELKAPIYMATHPVTVEEFLKFVESSGYDFPEEDRKKMRSISPQPNCPAVYISWLDAKEYCRWLRKETGEYYSLPSEAEWELAARGVDGRPFPWGYEEPDVNSGCFEGEKTYKGTVPVGSFPVNKSPFGCLDMIGNVWEWCLDDVDDPREPHILRGGSWCNNVEFADCLSKTFSYPPDKRPNYGGFRVIYLTDEMFEEYRAKIGEDDFVPSTGLKVIRAVTQKSTKEVFVDDTTSVPEEDTESDSDERQPLNKSGTAPGALPNLGSAPPAANKRPEARTGGSSFGGRDTTGSSESGIAPRGIDKRDLESMGVKFKRTTVTSKKSPPAASGKSSVSGRIGAADVETGVDSPAGKIEKTASTRAAKEETKKEHVTKQKPAPAVKKPIPDNELSALDVIRGRGEKANIAAMTTTNYVMFGIWCVLLLAVFALFCDKVFYL